MTTLKEVQENIKEQIHRDYYKRTQNNIMSMCTCGLFEEVGEVAGIFKRGLRMYEKDKAQVTREHLVEELGDVLWYFTAICSMCSIDLDEVWEANVKKLEERYGQNKSS